MTCVIFVEIKVGVHLLIVHLTIVICNHTTVESLLALKMIFRNTEQHYKHTHNYTKHDVVFGVVVERLPLLP